MWQKLLFIALFCSESAMAEVKSWQLWKHQNGVSIHYKKHDNGIFEVRGTVTVSNTNAGDFMALLSDAENAPQWIENVKSVKILARLSPSETVVYTQLDSPWPVSDRDMVSYSCYKRLNNTDTELKISAYPDYFDEQPNMIRITEIEGSWLLSEKIVQGLPQLTIVHEIYADPGGAIPHWISNKVGLKSALLTMLTLEKKLLSKDFQTNNTVSKTGECTAKAA